MIMKHLIILLFFILFSTHLLTQPLDGANPEASLSSANELFQSGDYYNALDIYELYYRENTDLQVAHRIATIHLQLRDYAAAERWFGLIVNNPSFPFLADAYFKYAQMLKMNGKYREAKTSFQSFIDKAQNESLMERALVEIAGCDMALESNEAKDLSIKNIGDRLNSKYSEYSPIMVNDYELYFTAIQSNKVIVIEDAGNDLYSKAYVSLNIEGKWGNPRPLNANINEPGYHVGTLCLSKDGKTLYFTKVLTANSIPTQSKLYVSKKINNIWGAAEPAQGINGDYLVSQPAIGELFGNEVLFFTADIDKEGHQDIYYSSIKGNSFTKPKKLSETINSTGDEASPFFKDGTLYFSSNGHPGLGGFDIFYSTWDGSNWASPENLGKGYNSSVDDLYFSINKDGDSGFLVSNREGNKSIHSKTCCNDIWTFNKENLQAYTVGRTQGGRELLHGATINIQNTDALTPQVDVQLLNGATITVTNTKNLEKNYRTSTLTFEPKKFETHTVIAQKTGFIGDTLTFMTSRIAESQDIKVDLFLTPIPPVLETYTINEPIELKNIFYDYDKWDISNEAEQGLMVLLDLMNQYPDMVIELSSHTDSRGEGAYNKYLSQRRADAVKSWLTKRKISEDRIQAVGYGEDQIRNKCVDEVECNEAEHAFNRRTEFKIIAGPSSIEIEKKRLKFRGN